VSSLSGTSLEGSVEAIPHRIFVVYGGVLQVLTAYDVNVRIRKEYHSTLVAAPSRRF